MFSLLPRRKNRKRETSVSTFKASGCSTISPVANLINAKEPWRQWSQGPWLTSGVFLHAEVK
jgi:hypothetical protein